MFIVRPDLEDEEADKLIESLTNTVKNGGGAVRSAEKMGRRKLAYNVRKFSDGSYVLLTIEATGPVVLELERRLRVTEQVIKFITVRMDEEEKRLAKLKALRGTRRKASSESAPAPAAAPAAVATAEPAEPVQASA
jgi:small subunit ribosomal protein S6